jgi:hypothetical protein
MRRTTRRILYLLLLLLWLIVMLLPVFAVVLAARQQIEIGADPKSHVRIFLLQEPATRGIGVEWARPSAGRSGCAQATLSYLLWRGEAENVRFCRCYDDNGQFLDSSPGACPEG